MIPENISRKITQPIAWTNEVWTGDRDGDITIEFEGYTWQVKRDIVATWFPWIKASLATANPGSQVVVRPRTSKTARPRIFSALLQFLHTNELQAQIWEDDPSFFTYIEYYFLGERFNIPHLQLHMVKCVEDLSWHVLSLSEAHCSHCPLSRVDVDAAEKQHLASFLDAVLAVEAQPWSAKIAKAMYDAGDRMKGRLVRLPAFWNFRERFPVGRDFARAIGVGSL